MSTFREKAQGLTKQVVGQMIGDQQLVEEGREQEHEAELKAHASDPHIEQGPSDGPNE
ncbi:hypothetical protein JQ628_26400 [Bradyrhizobium lablabi]|uniref:hypothetical protein n=1 Tax=Bradyrhizobium lablabi TaxID=722472 RepID=UPI001BA8A708|nr:hypothetical protein [Bradyrhizobium lablabi]MBR1125079.1 hypothetical protein [Bradyrhizobium lablabi]